jgi:glyoxylase-like metal-dependent hydrolase (beta-lactamase superfamily II)
MGITKKVSIMTRSNRFSYALRMRTVTAAFALNAFGVTLTPTPAVAAAAMVKSQAPGFYRMMLGDFEVTVINDGTTSLDVDKLLAEPPAKTEAALKKSFEASPVETSSNAFLINTGTKLVLIDTGAGALLGPTLGKLLMNVRAAGYKPEQIDDVFLTHMHPDHVGGLMADGALAFPNATLHANKRDSDYWLSQANLDKAPADAKGYFQGAMASVNPYVAAGKYQPFETDGERMPGVHSIATYGHSAGHTSYLVESKGQKLMVIGDLIHVAAVQFSDPGVTIAFDSDAAAAAATRKKVFGELASDGVLLGAEHLQFPAFGHLRAAGKSWQWVPVNYSTQIR